MKQVLLVLLAILPAGCVSPGIAGIPDELSLEARMERGKAFVPPKRIEVPAKWLEVRCSLVNAHLKGDSKVSRTECIDELIARLPAFDPSRPRDFGEKYSPLEYRKCLLESVEVGAKATSGSCPIYALRRNENPYYWPYEHNKDFKWPEPEKRVEYRPGMSGDEYFNALCKVEAGLWIHRTVDKVEGYYEVRGFSELEDDWNTRDRYVVENPLEFWLFWGQFTKISAATQVMPRFKRYRYLERPLANVQQDLIRHEGPVDGFLYGEILPDSVNPINDRTIVIPKKKIKSRYGFVWRGADRPFDRDLFIAGVEWAVVDLETNEVLSLMRVFIRGKYGFEGFSGCPGHEPTPPRQFLWKTLKPVLAD